MKVLIHLFALGGLVIVLAGELPEVPPHFVTTPFLEPDRCATAWVIKRHVNPEARFSFHPREAIPENVQLFDLPEATLKRDARRATVEVLVEREQLDDSLVLRVARLVHDIEINAWATRREPGSVTFEDVLFRSFKEAGTAERALVTCFDLLDKFGAANGEIDPWVEAIGRQATDSLKVPIESSVP